MKNERQEKSETDTQADQQRLERGSEMRDARLLEQIQKGASVKEALDKSQQATSFLDAVDAFLSARADSGDGPYQEAAAGETGRWEDTHEVYDTVSQDSGEKTYDYDLKAEMDEQTQKAMEEAEKDQAESQAQDKEWEQ